MLTIEGNIVNTDNMFRGRIEIGDNGIISAVGKETGSADLVLKDELIFPGFIDLHVHARECADHSQDYKEDFTSAGQAAINGGVVAFADMPNIPVPPVDEASYNEKEQLAKKSAVEVLLYAGTNAHTRPLKWKAPYKIYISKSVGDLFFSSFEELDAAIPKYSGQSVSFHCEDPEILEKDKNQATHENRRPPEAEISAVEFALKMVEKYNLTGKICHCSTIEGLKKIIQAKKNGLKVTVEVTPHHLYFDDTVIASAAEAISNKEGIASSDALLAMTKFFQVNPPIRQSAANRLALIRALKNGDIDYLATDHAPHSLEEKEKGMSGLTHLDTYGPFVTWLMEQHGFTPQDIARVCGFNPGNFMNEFLPNKYGKIAEGFTGSLTVINPTKPITISRSILKTKAGWSPFEGITFPGSVAQTIIKGKIYGR